MRVQRPKQALAIPLYTNLQPTGGGGDNYERALALINEQLASKVIVITLQQLRVL